MAIANESQIYSRLAAAPTFRPVSAAVLSDWSVEPGDVVSITGTDESYTVPVYSSRLKWVGGKGETTLLEVQSTGNQKRAPLSPIKRREYASGAGGYAKDKEHEEKFRQYERAVIDTDELLGLYAYEFKEDKNAQEGRMLVVETAIEQTARAITLRAKMSDVEAMLQVTASSIWTRIQDIEGSYSTIIQTVDSITARVQSAEGSYSMILQTVDSITARVQSAEGSYSQIVITVDSITSRVQATEGSYSTIIQTVDSITSRVESAEGSYSQIVQTVSSITAAVTALEGSYSQISQTATSITSRVQNLEGSYSTLVQTASSLTSQIATKVGSTEVASVINQTAQSVLIQASKIDLSGYVTASSLEAEYLKASSLEASISEINLLQVKSLSVLGSIYFGAEVYSPHFVSMTGAGTAATGKVLGARDIELAHYHAITVTESNGVVTITQGAVQETAGSDSFNMADTAWYAGRVSAFKTAVSTALGSAGWSASGHNTNISLSFDASSKKVILNSAVATIAYPGDANATSVSISLPSEVMDLSSYWPTAYTLNKGSWSGGSRTVAMNDGNTTIDSATMLLAGGTVSWGTGANVNKATVPITDSGTGSAVPTGQSITVDASARYNAGWSAAYSSVSLPLQNTTDNMTVYYPSSTVGTTASSTYTLSLNSTTYSSTSYVRLRSSGGTQVARLDVGAVYTAGRDSVTQRTVSSLQSITLGASETGSTSKNTTVTFSDGNTQSSVPITINASSVYTAGQNYIINSLAVTGGVTSVSSSTQGTLRVTVFYGDSGYETFSVTGNISAAYDAGWGAAQSKVSWPTASNSSTITYYVPSSTVGSSSSKTYTLSRLNEWRTDGNNRYTYVYVKNGDTTVGRYEVNYDKTATSWSISYNASGATVSLDVNGVTYSHFFPD